MGSPKGAPTRSIVPLNDPNKTEGSTIRLPAKRWSQLDQALKFEKEIRAAAKVTGAFKLNELVDFLLKWALQQYWAENGPKPKSEHERKQRVAEALERRLKLAKEQAAAGDEDGDDE